MQTKPDLRKCRQKSGSLPYKDVAAVVDAAERARVVTKGRTTRAAGLCQGVIDVLKSSFIVACTVGVVLSAQEMFSPARYSAGAIPALPAIALGGGQVFVELTVNRDGRVTALTPLRTTPPFTDLVVDAVRDWQFRPAEGDIVPEPGRTGEPPLRTAVASAVLVAAVFRPPTLDAPTFGEAPRDIAPASDETAFPRTTVVPPFPPSAFSSSVVLLEARVDRQGAVADATVIRSAPPFDAAAQAAVRQWSFRPARVRGVSVSTFVDIVFGFPVPVTGAPKVPRSLSVNPPSRAPASASGCFV